MTPTRCAECWREYEPTPDGIRQHQTLQGHRPCPEDGHLLTGQWVAGGRTAAPRKARQ